VLEKIFRLVSAYYIVILHILFFSLQKM